MVLIGAYEGGEISLGCGGILVFPCLFITVEHLLKTKKFKNPSFFSVVKWPEEMSQSELKKEVLNLLKSEKETKIVLKNEKSGIVVLRIEILQKDVEYDCLMLSMDYKACMKEDKDLFISLFRKITFPSPYSSVVGDECLAVSLPPPLLRCGGNHKENGFAALIGDYEVGSKERDHLELFAKRLDEKYLKSEKYFEEKERFLKIYELFSNEIKILVNEFPDLKNELSELKIDFNKYTAAGFVRFSNIYIERIDKYVKPVLDKIERLIKNKYERLDEKYGELMDSFSIIYDFTKGAKSVALKIRLDQKLRTVLDYSFSEKFHMGKSIILLCEGEIKEVKVSEREDTLGQYFWKDDSIRFVNCSGGFCYIVFRKNEKKNLDNWHFYVSGMSVSGDFKKTLNNTLDFSNKSVKVFVKKGVSLIEKKNGKSLMSEFSNLYASEKIQMWKVYVNS